MLEFQGDRFEVLRGPLQAYLQVFLWRICMAVKRLKGPMMMSSEMRTKIADLHFMAAETYRARVIRMGEDLDRVWCVGGGLDEVTKLDRIERPELEASLGISRGETSLVGYLAS